MSDKDKSEFLKKAMEEFKKHGGGTKAEPINEEEAEELKLGLNKSFRNFWNNFQDKKFFGKSKKLKKAQEKTKELPDEWFGDESVEIEELPKIKKKTD